MSACNPPCAAGDICTATLECIRDPRRAGPQEASPPSAKESRERDLVGGRAFAGILVGGGISLHSWRAASGNRLDGPTSWGAFIFALRAGVLINQFELMLEYAPSSFRPVSGSGASDALDNGAWLSELTTGIGYHIRVAESVYWPLRIGAGFVMAGDRTDFQGRVDLFNVSVKTKYVLFDASFPSVRYVSDFNAYHRWTGLLAIGASYISP